jgi:hypothetical protein
VEVCQPSGWIPRLQLNVRVTGETGTNDQAAVALRAAMTAKQAGGASGPAEPDERSAMSAEQIADLETRRAIRDLTPGTAEPLDVTGNYGPTVLISQSRRYRIDS